MRSIDEGAINKQLKALEVPTCKLQVVTCLCTANLIDSGRVCTNIYLFWECTNEFTKKWTGLYWDIRDGGREERLRRFSSGEAFDWLSTFQSA